jgi:hypothetical protein
MQAIIAAYEGHPQERMQSDCTVSGPCEGLVQTRSIRLTALSRESASVVPTSSPQGAFLHELSTAQRCRLGEAPGPGNSDKMPTHYEMAPRGCDLLKNTCSAQQHADA